MRKAGARIMTTNDITNSAPVVRKAVDGSVIPAVKAVQVHKAFGPLHVLKGIDLTVMPGTVTVILGPSGSGKSTFLRLINQLETLTGGSNRGGRRTHRLQARDQKRPGHAADPGR